MLGRAKRLAKNLVTALQKTLKDEVLAKVIHVSRLKILRVLGCYSPK